jgi:ParB family chromosome partitioning protein
MSAAGAGASGGRRLGRGLESLLGPISRDQAKAEGNLRELPVADVQPNPYQPRTHFDPVALQELVDSIAASGLLQPVVVRERNGKYELIAGERRLRAVQQLGWKEVPAVIKEVDDQTLLTLALIENLQRHDLSPIDEATGYQRLQDEFKVPQTEVARLVGRNRSTVANILRLLKLPDDVRDMVHRGALSEGHARALLSLETPSQISRLAQQAVTDGWSVRETEARVKNGARAPVSRTSAQKRILSTSTEARRVEDALRKRLGTDVTVTQKRKGRGLVSISYYSNDDLARLLELILGQPFEG